MHLMILKFIIICIIIFFLIFFILVIKAKFDILRFAHMFCEGAGQFNLYSSGHKRKERSNMKEPVWFLCIVFIFSALISNIIWTSSHFSFDLSFQRVHPIEEWVTQNYALVNFYSMPTLIFGLQPHNEKVLDVESKLAETAWDSSDTKCKRDW